MKTIFKYPIEIIAEQTVRLPFGAKLLHVAEQGWDLMLWAMHDVAEERKEDRTILVVGTGHPTIPDDAFFVGTALMKSGLVWHVFEAPQ